MSYSETIRSRYGNVGAFPFFYSVLFSVSLLLAYSPTAIARSVTEVPGNFTAQDFQIPVAKPNLFKTKRTLFKWEVQSHVLRNQQLARNLIKDADVLDKMPIIKKLVKVYGEEAIVGFMGNHDKEKLYDEVLDYLTKQKGIHIEKQKPELREKLYATRDRFNDLEHELADHSKIEHGLIPNEHMTKAELDEALETIETWADWKDRHLNPENEKEFNKKMISAHDYADEYIEIQKQRKKIIPESKMKVLNNIKVIDKIIDNKPGFYEKATAGIEARTFTAKKIKALPLPARAPFFAAMQPVAKYLGPVGMAYTAGEWIYSGRDLGEEATLLSMGTISEIGQEDLSEEAQLDSYNWVMNKSFDERLRWSCQIPNKAKVQLGAACIKSISCTSTKSLNIELESLKDLPSESRMKNASGNPSRTFKVEFLPGLSNDDMRINETMENGVENNSNGAAWSLSEAMNKANKKSRLPQDPDLKFLVQIKSPLRTCCRGSKKDGVLKSCFDNLKENDEKFHLKSIQKISKGIK
ncbi:MAG: hypothetical protein ACXVCP_13095 [Bdellovibrio sp.]